MKLKALREALQQSKIQIDKHLNADLRKLKSIYDKGGYELRIVGGAVRDILSNKHPKDIDLASNATPEQSEKLLADNNVKTIDVGQGAAHGVIIAHMDTDDYEIATLRIDKNADGRHADVEYTADWQKDAERRDLTFNAMSMDFDGTIYDYFDGKIDLDAGKAKFVGHAPSRMQEDYLRILRYFRFQGRINSPTFDNATIDDIADNAGGLKTEISGERIWMEMAKILSGDHLKVILEKMRDATVLDNIGLPSANISTAIKVKTFTNNNLLILAALLKDSAELVKLRARWKFNTDQFRTMLTIINYRDKKVIPEYLYFRKKAPIPEKYITLLFEYKNQLNKLPDWDSIRDNEMPVKGSDLPITPGPAIGEVIEILIKNWVDSKYTLSKDELVNSLDYGKYK